MCISRDSGGDTLDSATDSGAASPTATPSTEPSGEQSSAVIGKDQIAAAVSAADEAIQGKSLEDFYNERGVDLRGLAHVATQRGLRAAMELRGRAPNEDGSVNLDLMGLIIQAVASASFMDGFAARLELDRRAT